MGDKPPDEEFGPDTEVHIFRPKSDSLYGRTHKFMYWHLNRLNDGRQECTEPVLRYTLCSGDTADASTKWNALATLVPKDYSPLSFLTEDGQWQVFAVEIKAIETPNITKWPGGETPYRYGAAHGVICCSLTTTEVIIALTELTTSDLPVVAMAKRAITNSFDTYACVMI